MAASLPHDLVLFRLLPRLPTKSVFRFKCVAREWYSFLSSDMFKRIHIHHRDDQQNHQNLIVLSTITTPLMFSTMDCEAPDNGLTPRRPIPSFETGRHEVKILTSFHGLVCVGLTNHPKYSDLFLWNPVTSEYKKLSKKNSPAECYDIFGRAFGLYHDSTEDDYKLLCITHEFHAYIYSLKSDSWRKRRSMIPSSKRDPNLSSHRDPYLVCGYWRLSTCLNEYLYFLDDTWKYKDRVRACPMRSKSVIRFDTKSEKFKRIATPSLEKDLNQNTKYSTMMVIGGSIHFCVRSETHTKGLKESSILLWKLNGDRKWEKVVTYEPKQGNLCFLKPLHLMKNGNWLLVDPFTPINLFTESRDNLHKLDQKNKNYSKWKDNLCYEEVRYIETLVSPNQYVE